MKTSPSPLLFKLLILLACFSFTPSILAYYSPEMGRWISRDPIAEKGGMNLYGMLGNDAVNKIDSLGQAPVHFGGDNPGVAWHAEPCQPITHLERRYIQFMVDYAPFGFTQDPQFDGATKTSPYYPDIEPNEPFQDTPGGLNGSPVFEVCRACVCKANGKIMAVGPCVSWHEPDMHQGKNGTTTDLSNLPSPRHSASPSTAFMQLLRRQYGSMMGSDESECPCSKKSR